MHAPGEAPDLTTDGPAAAIIEDEAVTFGLTPRPRAAVLDQKNLQFIGVVFKFAEALTSDR
jgi:hypothetical protein